MLAKEYTTETRELPVLSDFYCLPYVEIDMLDIDKSLFDLFSFEFMKRNKIIPVWQSSDGTFLIATGNPLDCSAMSAIATQLICPVDYVLVPPLQIDRYIDSIAAVLSTSAALEDVNGEGDAALFSTKRGAGTRRRSKATLSTTPPYALSTRLSKKQFPTARAIFISSRLKKPSKYVTELTAICKGAQTSPLPPILRSAHESRSWRAWI